MNEFYVKKMEELDADGIDFLSFGQESLFPNILGSYTKEELKKIKELPRTNYKFWKIVDGFKNYL